MDIQSGIEQRILQDLSFIQRTDYSESVLARYTCTYSDTHREREKKIKVK